MSLPAPTVVIFDMDGTTVRHLNPLVLHALEKIDDIGFRISKIIDWLFRRKAQGPIVSQKEEEEYRKWRKPRLYGHRLLHKVRRKEVDEMVEPCPGIYQVLKLLKDRNIPMALASNGLGKGYGHDIIHRFGLEEYFKTTIFREDVRKSKPNPEGLLKALKDMGANVGEGDVVWHIGDRHKDIKATLAAGQQLPCEMVPVAYGLNAAAAILENKIGTDHIFLSYQDMFKKLKALLP